MIYQITSTSWSGFIEIEFNELGYMTRTDTRQADLTEPQQKWFLNKMPRELAELQRVINGTTAVLTEIKQEVTFADAWKRYHDENGSKKKAEAKWNKMPKAEQLKAFEYIPKYLAKKPEAVPKLYFATYLNEERWNN